MIPVASTLTMPATEEYLAITKVIHELVQGWVDGLSIHEVRQCCTPKERWIAVHYTPIDHPMFRPLMRMLDELIETTAGRGGRCHWTHQGWFVDAELHEVQADIDYKPNGSLRITFPIRQPWRVKPSDGYAGEHGEPIYARTAAERAEWATRSES